MEKQHFLIKKSKPIIDEIDKVLAKHYGFTEEELDFIINYDIKYRMGKELEGEEWVAIPKINNKKTFNISLISKTLLSLQSNQSNEI